MQYRRPEPGLRCLWLIAALVPAGPAAAVETEVLANRYGQVLQSCLAAAHPDAVAACVGQMAGACMETEEQGYSTMGMMACTGAETDAWDVHLNTEYRATMDWAESLDASDRADFPEFAVRAETLREAQRAWIAFRDADCAFDYAVWGAGSMRMTAGANCLLERTAERTIELWQMRLGLE